MRQRGMWDPTVFVSSEEEAGGFPKTSLTLKCKTEGVLSCISNIKYGTPLSHILNEKERERGEVVGAVVGQTAPSVSHFKWKRGTGDGGRAEHLLHLIFEMREWVETN